MAARSLARDVAEGRLRPDDIDEAAVAARVALADQPPPDLFIRTGGDIRISNFLLWQLPYTELWFTDTPWPELDVAPPPPPIAHPTPPAPPFGLTPTQVPTLEPPPQPPPPT